MEIHKRNNEEFNFTDDQTSLFEAMRDGKVISKIVFIPKVRSKKSALINFTAKLYWCGLMENFEGTEKYDYVDGIVDGEELGFYMNWVESFKL